VRRVLPIAGSIRFAKSTAVYSQRFGLGDKQSRVRASTSNFFSTVFTSHMYVQMGRYLVAGLERSAIGWCAAENPAGIEEMP